MIKAMWIKLATLALAAAALTLGVWPALLVLAAGLGVIAWGVFNVNSSLWAPTRWRGRGKVVALTFDDGPDPGFTPRILQILAERGVTATFFCVGDRVRSHPELAAKIVRAGHLIGNHSDSHALSINFGMHRRLRTEITACNAAIAAAAGVQPRLYRPPHGFKNPALGDVLHALGMTAIGWQVRGFDAVRTDAAAIARRIVNGARPGGVITLHDGDGLHGTPDREATIEALPVILDGLEARGLKVVRLDELLDVEAYAHEQ